MTFYIDAVPASGPPPQYLPCPHCGEAVEFYPHNVFRNFVWFTHCARCGKQVRIERQGDAPPTISRTDKL